MRRARDVHPEPSTNPDSRDGRAHASASAPADRNVRSASLAARTNLPVTPSPAATVLTPNVVSVRHWQRLLGGALYAATPRLEWATLHLLVRTRLPASARRHGEDDGLPQTPRRRPHDDLRDAHHGTVLVAAWPNWRFVVVTEATKVLGTLATIYGWFVAPIGWKYALLVWVYALAWFVLNDTLKVAVFRLMRRGHRIEQRHVARIGARLHQPPTAA